jgi:hypothetical protein
MADQPYQKLANAITNAMRAEEKAYTLLAAEQVPATEWLGGSLKQ